MNCCNANGQCDRGKDCPVRKQHIKEINDAYAHGYADAQLGDPIDDLADTFKALVVVVAVTIVVGLLAFVIWGK